MSNTEAVKHEVSTVREHCSDVKACCTARRENALADVHGNGGVHEYVNTAFSMNPNSPAGAALEKALAGRLAMLLAYVSPVIAAQALASEIEAAPMPYVN